MGTRLRRKTSKRFHPIVLSDSCEYEQSFGFRGSVSVFRRASARPRIRGQALDSVAERSCLGQFPTRRSGEGW
jgi:hypothetical protein